VKQLVSHFQDLPPLLLLIVVAMDIQRHQVLPS
jgi:hypothetical protein